MIAGTDGKIFRAWVNEKCIRKISPDQPARIYSQSYEYFKFGCFTGKVLRVHDLPENRGGEVLYAVDVTLNGEPHKLKFGSTAEIKIVAGRKRIIQVLLGF